MERSRPACTWRRAAVPVATTAGLVVAAAVMAVACRAPSGAAEHEPAVTAQGVEPPSRPQDAASDEPASARASEAAPSEPREPAVAPSEPSDPAATPAPSDPAATPAPSDPAATPAPSDPARAKPCRRPSPRAKGPLRDLVGLDEAAVRRCLGAPDRTSGSTWHYQWPKGCAYEVSRVVVRFAQGKVTRAQADHEITGKHCGSDL